MNSRRYGRLFFVVGILTLSFIISARFSFVQPEQPTSLPDLQSVPPQAKLSHPACPTCFTYACSDCYNIMEEIPGTGLTIARQIPNPSPLEPDEQRLEFDPETGLPIWYIGRQPYVGPTDEQPFSPAYPAPLIDLKRIQLHEQEKIFSISGVHSFGIGEKGFVVYLTPEHRHNDILVPQEIQGVPVEVKFAEPFEPTSHWLTRFAPVPAGVSVGARVFVPGQGTASTVGTLGPHIVRYTSEVRIHSLTSGHVLKLMDAPVSSVVVYQPTPASSNARQWGTLVRGFQHVPCDTAADPLCQSSSAPINNTWEKPDIGVIQNITPADSYPHTSPPNSDEPIRRLQYGTTSYVNGPSGIIVTPAFGTGTKVWGALIHAPAGSVAELVTSVVSNFSVAGGSRRFKFQYLCVVNLERGLDEGDSGALVTGNGTGNRHVFGVMFGRTPNQPTRGTFILAQDIKTALNNSGFPFDHFWGTASGRPDLWNPAATQCDGSC
jgi:hypothetical protein